MVSSYSTSGGSSRVLLVVGESVVVESYDGVVLILSGGVCCGDVDEFGGGNCDVSE